MTPKARTEREVTRDIVNYLELEKKYRPNRLIAGPVWGKRGDRHAPQHTNPPGYPDWIFSKAGEIDWYMEIKAPGKRPTPLQLAWLERLRKDGFTADWFDGFRPPEGKKPFLEDGNK